jgi:hypothetical protein
VPWREAIAYLFFAARLPDVLRERFREDFRGGTFAPFSRASLSPMAIACLRLVTFRPDPLFSVPFFLRRIVDSTFFDADFPYFAMRTSWLSFANHVLTRWRVPLGCRSQLDGFWDAAEW